MANSNNPNGAHPFGPLLRATPCTSTGTVYPGDFVTSDSSGGVTATSAGAGNTIRGVALHYATAGQSVLVADHPDQEFYLQAYGNSVSTIAAALNMNCQIKATAGNTTYKMSRMSFDDSTLATNSNYQLKVMRVLQDVDAKTPGLDSISAGGYWQAVVRINTHQLQSAGIVGV